MFLGKADCYTLDDGWGVKSCDHSLAAHYEHSIDIPNKRLDLKVSEEELAKRREKFVPKMQETDSVFLNRYRAHATSGVEGAVLK